MGFLRRVTDKYGDKEEQPPQQDIGDGISQGVQEAVAGQHVQEVLGGGQTPFAEFIYAADLPPLKILEMYPVLKNKVLALTNLPDGQALDNLMAHIDTFYTNYKLWTPKRNQEVEIYNEFDMLRTFTLAQAWRSTGGKDRDRALLTTVTTYADKPAEGKRRPGVLGKLREAIF